MIQDLDTKDTISKKYKLVQSIFVIINTHCNRDRSDIIDFIRLFSGLYKINSLDKEIKGKNFELLSNKQREYSMLITELETNIVDNDEIDFLNTYTRYVKNCLAFYRKDEEIPQLDILGDDYTKVLIDFIELEKLIMGEHN